jgi:hypothetical protein
MLRLARRSSPGMPSTPKFVANFTIEGADPPSPEEICTFFG